MNAFTAGFDHQPLKKIAASVSERLTKVVMTERLTGKVGHILLAMMALCISCAIAFAGLKLMAIILAVVVGLPLIYAVIVYPKFGIMVLLITAYLIMMVTKFSDLPIGVLMDGMGFLLVVGFFIKHKYHKDWGMMKNPVAIMIIIWITYNMLQAINPNAASRMAWLFTVRTVAFVMVTYFLFVYHIRSAEFIRLILKTWLMLSLFAALYSFKQEYFGFFRFENDWLAKNPAASSLYFINDHWRKFSIFSDPVASAYNMALSSLLCITLLFGPVSKLKKVALAVLTLLFTAAMLHSGTRGAFILIPAGLAMLFIIKFNKKVFFIGLATIVVLAVIIKKPTSNATIQRFQSAFNPTTDASYNIRVANQKRIQPYILEHPMGGGLGSTGTWGQRFSPNTYLASFPPDSGYVRVAVEMGWIGLLIICTLMFVAIKTAINNYFAIKDSELKNYCLAMAVLIFTLNIGNFPQEALVQYPINIYFCLFLALVNILLRLDKEKISRSAAVASKSNSNKLAVV